MLSNKQQPGQKTGIDLLGNTPWGTHFCLFYKTEKDLIDILVPYFKAGLENNEFCMWVCWDPLRAEEARTALSKTLKNLDNYIDRGQIEIVDYSKRYTIHGDSGFANMQQFWIEKEKLAFEKGFEGLRLAGNTYWLESDEWESFAQYEEEVDEIIRGHKMLAICPYCLDKCGASEIIDVVNNHRFALIKRQGKWELLESTKRKKAEEALKVSENKYRTLLENLPQKVYLKDKDSVYISCNENYARDLKIEAEEITGKTDYDFFPKELAEKYKADDKRIIKFGKTEDVNEKYIQNGREAIVHTVKSPVRDEQGNVVGILDILWDITAQRQAQKKLLAYQKRLRDLASEMSLTEERQRKRIAIELHDQVTQNLILFKINLGELQAKELPEELVKPLGEIYKHLDQVIQDMRSLTFDLGSPTLYELGLEVAVREYLNEEIQQKHGIKTEFEDDAQPKPLGEDICALLYRAVRELLINVVKHAQAQCVKVSICKSNNKIRINVIDDGGGFKPPTEGFGSGKTAGFGLFSIRERLSYFGGSVEIESKLGKGTQVTLVAPMKRGKNVEGTPFCKRKAKWEPKKPIR